MVGIHRIGVGGTGYYLSDLARELPIGRGGRGVWVGAAATGLGLEGRVDAAGLDAVLGGRNPSRGRLLRSDRATVAGYDLTFSAPKSASLLLALGDEETAQRVVEAHVAAVAGTTGYVERHALSACRGGGGERQVIGTTGVVGAAFTHGVNRNLDPHLHTHVVVANLVHGTDGRWSALDQRGLWAHRGAARAVYEAHLRGELTRDLGVRWEGMAGLGAQVRGMPPELVGEFSSRGADIRRHMAAFGSRSARGAHVAWAATRPEKVSGLSFESLRRDWARRARSVGDGRAELEVGMGAIRQRERPVIDEHRFRASLSLAADGAARRRDVMEGLGVGAVQGAPASTVDGVCDLWVPPTGRGVDESAHALRAVAPGDHLMATLGPRPLQVEGHRVWREGARAIDAYRQRWGVGPGGDALGVDERRGGLAALPAARLADHVRTARLVEVTRQRLGWREPPERAMDRGR